MAGRRVRVQALLALFIIPAALVACAGAAAPLVSDNVAPNPGVLVSREESSGDTDKAMRLAEPDGAPGAAATTTDDALIIRTGTLDLEVADVAAILPRARDLVTGLGGYVSASDQSEQSGRLAASVTYRIPASRWDAALEGLRALGDRLTAESTQAVEVTSQVVDLKARITNLRASEAALVEIMGRAGSIDDVLAVQLRLQDVREQIELLVAQQQDLEGRAAYATLVVMWQTPLVAVTQASSGWDLGHEIDRAAAQTVSAFHGLVSTLVWLVVVGVPVFGPFLLIGLVVLTLLRRSMRGRHAGPAATPPAQA